MIVSRYLSPDRSLALEISQSPGELSAVEVVFREDSRRQTLPSSLVPRSPVLFSQDNNIIIFHEGTSSMGSWPVAFRRAENGAYEPWGADAGDSLGRQLAAQLPDTVSIARMWIRGLEFVSGQRIEAEAAVSRAAGKQIEGRFRFVYDVATAKIETILVSPEITEIRDYWGVPTSTGSGFFISRDGLILTAKHVVTDVLAIFVQDFDGRRYRGEVDEQGYYDVALLKVDAEAPGIIPISPEAELKIGQKTLNHGLSGQRRAS